MSSFSYSSIPGLFLCPLPKGPTTKVFFPLFENMKTGCVLKSSIFTYPHKSQCPKKNHPNFGFRGLAVSYAELRKPKLYITHRPRKVIDNILTNISNLTVWRPLSIYSVSWFRTSNAFLWWRQELSSQKHCLQGLTMNIRPCRVQPWTIVHFNILNLSYCERGHAAALL
jgi:hypothetical protein